MASTNPMASAGLRPCLSLIFIIALLKGMAAAQGMVVTREINSRNFANNKAGTSPIRKMAIYLPAGYEQSSRRYPVIYFLSSAWEGYDALFEKNAAQQLFDTAIAAGIIGPFILVSADTNTPLGSSWYLNSPVTGNWEDFLLKELVSYIDQSFRTLVHRDSRGLLGDRPGGYGAIRLGMRHPDVFGSVYALHPVGTGSGLQIMHSRPDWDLLTRARSAEDLKGDIFSSVFATIFQAHLPNPDKAPLFIDLPARRVAGQLIIDAKLNDQLRNSFLLETMIPRYAENLKSLRGFKFDWGRSDSNQDHVYSNQAFTHKLDEYGIAHEAEEYRGAWGERNWGQDGRVYTDALPFFQRCLIFSRH